MRIRPVRRGIVLCCGWFVLLVAAAVVLPPIGSKEISGNAGVILALAGVWLLLTVAALARYLVRAWKRVPKVSHKTTYIAWLTFETGCVLASVCGLVWLLIPGYVTSPRHTREWVLRQDLVAMRDTISQYTLDLHKRPISLDDLVVAGYLKEVPIDPLPGGTIRGLSSAPVIGCNPGS